MPPEPMRSMREVRMRERRAGGRDAWRPARMGGMVAGSVCASVDILAHCVVSISDYCCYLTTLVVEAAEDRQGQA